MSDTFLNIREGILIVATAADLPPGVPVGTPAVTADTGDIYTYDGSSWNIKGATSGTGIVSLNGQTGTSQTFANSTAGTSPSFSSAANLHTLNIPLASTGGVIAGLISKTEYDIFNAKQSALSFGNITSGTAALSVTGGTSSTVGPAVNLSIVNATSGQTGLLTATDWNTFNNKQNSLTIGNITTTTTGLTIGGGTGAIIGSGVTVNVQTATTSQPGLLSSTDWNTFNNKLDVNPNFIALTAQGSPPTTPASGFKLYADSSHRLSWKGQNGFTRTFDGVSNTADRIYTLPNYSGTFLLTGLIQYASLSVTGTVTISSTDTNTIYLVDTNAARTINLPNPALVTNRVYIFKDVTGLADTNNITIARFGSEKIEGLTSNKTFSSPFGCWTFYTNGTDWFLI